MSRRVEAAAIVLGAVALLLAVLIVARVSARGGRPPSVLSTGPTPGAAPTAAAVTTVGPAAPAPGCDVGAATGGLQLRGACRGALAAPFGCVGAVDDLYLTGRHPLDATHVLYLTVNIESYKQHPGEYRGAQTVLQVTGPVSVARWSNYGVSVAVNRDGSVTVPTTDLDADAGTGSGGTVTVSGTIGCAP